MKNCSRPCQCKHFGMWGRAWSLVALLLKVSLSRKEILVPWVLQKKNELENVNFCPSLLEQKFFVRFLGELKKTKSSFEINWPLLRSESSTFKLKAFLRFLPLYVYWYEDINATQWCLDVDERKKKIIEFE